MSGTRVAAGDQRITAEGLLARGGTYAPSPVAPTGPPPLDQIEGWRHPRIHPVELDENPNRRFAWDALRRSLPDVDEDTWARLEDRSGGDVQRALFVSMPQGQLRDDAALVVLGDASTNGWSDEDEPAVLEAFQIADHTWSNDRKTEPWGGYEARTTLRTLGVHEADLNRATGTGHYYQRRLATLAEKYAHDGLSAVGVMGQAFGPDSTPHHRGHNLPGAAAPMRSQAIRGLLDSVSTRIP